MALIRAAAVRVAFPAQLYLREMEAAVLERESQDSDKGLTLSWSAKPNFFTR